MISGTEEGGQEPSVPVHLPFFFSKAKNDMCLRLAFSTALFALLVLLPAYGQEQPSDGTALPATVSTTIQQAVPTTIDPRLAVTEVTRVDFFDAATDSFRRLNGLAGPGNTARVTQIGERNVTVLNQYGERNVASFFLQGDRNDVLSTQEGVGNLLDVSLIGNDNRIPIIQNGEGLAMRLDLESNDLLLQNPGIQQTGQGMSVIIEYKPGIRP